MNKTFLLLTIFFCLAVDGYPKNKEAVRVSISKEVVPVLIGKAENAVLTLKVNNPADTEITVDGITLGVENSGNLSGIETVRIYFTGVSADFSPLVLFGETQKPGKKLNFKGKQVLKPGDNYFFASVSLSPKARMSDKINLTCEQVQVTDNDVLLQKTSSNLPLRVGYAVRKQMDDGVNTFRIPGLVRTPKGTLLSVYDIRWKNAGDLQGDIDVGVSRSLDNGQTWLPMQKAIDMKQWGNKPDKENGIGDPAILVDEQTGRIWISALWLHGNPGKAAWWASKPGMAPEETGQFILAYSDDEGATWSEPVNITPQIKNPEWFLCFNGPGMGISKKDGTLVFAAQFKDKDQVPHSTIVYSKDHGKIWHMGTGAKPKTTEAQVVELADGSLMLNMRDDRGGARSVAVTKDFGTTWEEHPTSRKALQEPVCMASIIRIRLKDGREALAFFNPDTTSGRSHLTLKLSLDEGQTWPEQYQMLVYQPGSYGYSCLTQLDPETLGVLYEGAGDLYFQQLDLKELFTPGK